MSDHADTVRDAIRRMGNLSGYTSVILDALAALDALVAERDEWKARRDELYQWQIEAIAELDQLREEFERAVVSWKANEDIDSEHIDNLTRVIAIQQQIIKDFREGNR